MEAVRRLGSVALVVFATVILPAGCRSVPGQGDAAPSAVGDRGEAVTRTELFFGLSKPGGGTVSAAEWADFLSSVVTPRFRQGLTVVDGRGQWQNSAGTVCQEPCRIVILLYPANQANREAIEAIRHEYRRRFQQESVLRVTSAAGVSF